MENDNYSDGCCCCSKCAVLGLNQSRTEYLLTETPGGRKIREDLPFGDTAAGVQTSMETVSFQAELRKLGRFKKDLEDLPYLQSLYTL